MEVLQGASVLGGRGVRLRRNETEAPWYLPEPLLIDKAETLNKNPAGLTQSKMIQWCHLVAACYNDEFKVLPAHSLYGW